MNPQIKILALECLLSRISDGITSRIDHGSVYRKAENIQLSIFNTLEDIRESGQNEPFLSFWTDDKIISTLEWVNMEADKIEKEFDSNY